MWIEARSRCPRRRDYSRWNPSRRGDVRWSTSIRDWTRIRSRFCGAGIAPWSAVPDCRAAGSAGPTDGDPATPVGRRKSVGRRRRVARPASVPPPTNGAPSKSFDPATSGDPWTIAGRRWRTDAVRCSRQCDAPAMRVRRMSADPATGVVPLRSIWSARIQFITSSHKQLQYQSYFIYLFIFIFYLFIN